MKSFQSLVVLKRSPQELWTILRDHLPDVAAQIADIDEIRQIERTVDGNDIVHIVNKWRVRQQVPAVIRSILKTSELSWIDRNSWDARTLTCTWTIEPNILTKYIACSGRTTFVAAMAGQGSRVTLAGELDLKPGMLGGSLGGFDKVLSGFLELIVTTVIPRNLRGVIEAAAGFELPK